MMKNERPSENGKVSSADGDADGRNSDDSSGEQEKFDPPQLFADLQSSEKGLTSDEAATRLEEWGPNALDEKKQSKILQFLMFMWNPLSWVMEAAALVAIAVANGGGDPPDWQDFIGIVLLLLVNSSIGYWEESRAGDTVAALKRALAPNSLVLRDGEWSSIEARNLVPGDVCAIKLGDIIPADAVLIERGDCKVDQAALTGESLPVTKGLGDLCYSGAVLKQGDTKAVVKATGAHTFFGRAAKLVSQTQNTGHLQQVLTRIGIFCVGLILVWTVIVLIVVYAAYHYEYRRGISLMLVLLIGGVPIAMPTVLSVTLAIGAKSLARKDAIVTRMTAIEELAAMDILCSDKTGTLTKNELTIDDEMMLVLQSGVDKPHVKLLCARASRVENQDAIDLAIVGALGENGKVAAREGIEERDFMPFDPVAKRTEITYLEGGEEWRVTKGAPGKIQELCADPMKAEISKSVSRLARHGLRAILVATKRGAAPYELLAVVPIFDPPRDDTAHTIEQATHLGVSVRMITGDALEIGKETARRLRMGTNLYDARVLKSERHSIESLTGRPIEEIIEGADGFAGVFPEHKYDIVKTLRKNGHVVGMTGDGVNDAPALKVADVGVAVSGATDAARSAADIVLTAPGLSVIVDAILLSRKIFQRMKNYAMYACATTTRIVVGFSLMALIWKFDFPPFMVLLIAVLNDGTIMTISKDKVRPSPHPDSWHLFRLITMGFLLGIYLMISQIVLLHILLNTTFIQDHFGIQQTWLGAGGTPAVNDPRLHSFIYLEVSVTGQALIFITRAQRFWFLERPGVLLMVSFVLAQIIATIIAVYADWGFTSISGIGWGSALFVWIYSLIWMVPMDLYKLLIAALLNAGLWDRAFGTHTRSGGFDMARAGGAEEVRAGSIDATRARASVTRNSLSIGRNSLSTSAINKL